MHAYMSVFVNVCMGIYMYDHMYVKEHRGCIQKQCVHMQIYVYISGFVRVCVCVYIYTYMYEKTPFVYAECVHTNAYMSVLVPCLQVCFISVCRYIHIYM